jgi:hypothetical protein
MRRAFVVVAAALAIVAAVAPPAGATPPSDVEIAVETSLLGDPSPFTAFGPAVDEGIVCAGGTVVDASGKVTGRSPTGFNFQGVKRFLCDDGSGEFFVNLQARIDFRRGIQFHWNVLSGTGDLADLHGAGRGVGVPGVPCGDPDACVLDLYVGGLHLD